MDEEEYSEDTLQEEPESRMDNDEISPEEEGFMKGYEDDSEVDDDFDMNSTSE
ncbi:MAG: hypothetical protein ACLFTR_01500 [Candidatus Woesearchaeota archaeon]